MISISWTIKSNTTSTSAPLPEKGPRRCDSMNHGFLQKDIDPSQEEVFRHGIVKRCGDSDTDSLNFIEKVCVMKEGLGSISFRDIPGTRDVNVHHTDQLHIIDVSVFFSMELAKVTDT